MLERRDRDRTVLSRLVAERITLMLPPLKTFDFLLQFRLAR
jgi:hypothetical protein